MKKRAYLQSLKYFLLFFSFLTTLCHSQQNQNQSNFWNKVQIGGGLGLGIGNKSFNASLSPSAIYRATNEFSTGVALNVNYAKFDNAKLMAYGGSILTFYNPIPIVQFSAELEQLRINNSVKINGENHTSSYWSPALFAGIGYSLPNITMGVRYNLLHDNQKSIYSNAWMPFVRVYF
ncbi:hypothetical protein [Arenibacter latericius]|uniref:hypothetical protein n=1 Tax=Arenibacter latericius TaxID=86104 RepID=UPI0004211B05|nr:hypothetical protein [Arenibacter latericius]MDX1364045.1 alpha-ketoglutarate decarboxylase [Arenibacter latericius]